MIKDLFSLIGINIIILIISLVVSFVYYVSISALIEGFESYEEMDWTEAQSHYSQMFVIGDILQVAGIISIFSMTITSALLVTRMRFSPLALPFAIIFYFVAIFLSMVYSNTFVYMEAELQSYEASFTVNEYLSWIAIEFPYITAIVGVILMFLAYAKSPYKISPGGGLEVT